MIAVSIVSHGHGPMVSRLVASLLEHVEVKQIIVTLNIPETLTLPDDPCVLVIENRAPQGFGTNHNAAFKQSQALFFCPVNPDIELIGNPFPTLLQALGEHGGALAAPLVLAPDGTIEDSIRHFPTIASLFSKMVGGKDGRYDVASNAPVLHPEWVAGMFMLFRSTDFVRLGGFDESFFLYYEDVDICVRTWRAGMKILACPSVSVNHDARRTSHRNFQHMKWHAASMVRYFWKHTGRLPVAG